MRNYKGCYYIQIYDNREKNSEGNKANCNDNMKDNINRNFPLIQSPRRKKKGIH